MAEFPTKFRKSPCMNCERRYTLCHSSCTDYIAYDKQNKARQKAKQEYYIVANYEKDRTFSNMEANRKKQIKYRHY